MKKAYSISIIIVGLVFAASIFLINVSAKSKLTVDCYLYDPCGGCFGEAGPCKPCAVEAEYKNKYRKLISDNGLVSIIDLNVYNILYPIYESAYLNKLKDMGIEAEENYPIAFVGDKYFIGDQQIQEEMIQYIKNNTNLLSTVKRLLKGRIYKNEAKEMCIESKDEIMYFFSEYCNDCKRVDEFFYTKYGDKTGALHKINRCNISEIENQILLEQMLKQYRSDRQDITIPTIVINDKCLVGFDEIEKYFDLLPIEEIIEKRIPISDGK